MHCAQTTTPITAGDAEKAGTQPPAPYYAPSLKYVNSGMPTPRPPTLPYTGRLPTPTATPTPLPQVKIDGVRTDRVPTPVSCCSTRPATSLSWIRSIGR